MSVSSASCEEASLTESSKAQRRATVALRAAFWSALSLILPTLIGAAVLVVTARILTPADFGTVALATAIAVLAASLTPVGFGEALVQHQDLSPFHTSSVFWLCVTWATGVYGALVAASSHLAAFFAIDELAYLLPFIGTKVVIDAVAIVPNALTKRAMSFQIVAMRTFAATAVAGVTSIVLVLSGFGMWALAFSQVVSSLVAAVAVSLAAKWLPAARPSLSALRDLTRYGSFASGSTMLNHVASQADSVVLGFALGSAQLGLYTFARRVYSVLNHIVAGTLSSVAHPLLSRVQHSPTLAKSGFLQATFASSVLAFPLFAGLAVTAPAFIPLAFGDQWVDVVWPLRVFCALGVITCIGVLQGSFIRSQGRADWWFYYQAATSLSSVAVILLLARFGAFTMLLGMLAKTLLLWPIAITMTLRLLKMRAAEYLAQFAAPLISSALMVAAVLARQSYVDIEGLWHELGADVLVGGVTYVVTVYLCAMRHMQALLKIAVGALRSQSHGS